MHKPLLPYLAALEGQLAAPASAPQPGAFARFAAEAARDPSAASAIRVMVHSCSELILKSADAARTYVQYEFPGYPSAVDTAVRGGRSPEFGESRTFEFGPHPQTAAAFTEALKVSLVSFAVFDAAAAGDDAQVGVANISISCASCSSLSDELA
jgi:hypothetical protein